MFLRYYSIFPKFSSLNDAGTKIRFRQVKEGSTFFGLHWSATPRSRCMQNCLTHTKAAGTRLAALGLDTGAKFSVSTQLPRARLCSVPGLQLLIFLSLGISSVSCRVATWRPSRV